MPVLTVCKPTGAVLSGDPDEPLLIGKILCAIDPSHVSLGALRSALSLARSYHATLLVLTVEQSEKQKDTVNDLKELVRPEKEEGCRVKFIHAEGDPLEQILNAITDYQIDLAVMGHHSNTFRPLELLGSVTLRVIPPSKCAVLVVRD